MSTPTDTFTHDNIEYDLTKVRQLVQSEKAFLLSIKDLLWILKFDRPDEHRVYHAKIRYPLLVTKWHNKWTVVDGLHRLERYRRKGITVIPVKEVTMNMLQQAKLSSF